MCIGVFSRDVGRQRVASFESIADCGFRLPDCGVSPCVWRIPISVAPSMLLGFTLVPRTFAECCACCWLLSYDRYGKPSIHE